MLIFKIWSKEGCFAATRLLEEYTRFNNRKGILHMYFFLKELQQSCKHINSFKNHEDN